MLKFPLLLESLDCVSFILPFAVFIRDVSEHLKCCECSCVSETQTLFVSSMYCVRCLALKCSGDYFFILVFFVTCQLKAAFA